MASISAGSSVEWRERPPRRGAHPRLPTPARRPWPPGWPPGVQFAPQLVFLVFTPPLLYRASLLASYRDMRANLRPILLLGVGHVLFVTIVVAWVAHLTVPGLPWASAFALGAVVSPPDVAAATPFLRHLPLPRRLVTILEGESMINDAAAIVAYRMAVAAAVTGSFSLHASTGRFLVVGAGGIAVGLAVGWLLAAVRRHIHDPEVETPISVLTGYAAYLPAEHLGVSGILAVVATGMYLGRVGPRIVAADTRVQNSGMGGGGVFARSEEGRVGEEGRSRGWPGPLKKKKKALFRARLRPNRTNLSLTTCSLHRFRSL